jgi:RHS repeat-associated protein
LNVYYSVVTATGTHNRVTSSSDNKADWYTADVLSYSDYYAFGAPMDGRKFVPATVYRYGFNGKETDDENAGDLDFGARIYDSRLGRFLSPDPKENDYPGQSTYVCAINNPIGCIDVNGEGVPLGSGDGTTFSTMRGANNTMIMYFKSQQTFISNQRFLSWTSSTATVTQYAVHTKITYASNGSEINRIIAYYSLIRYDASFNGGYAYMGDEPTSTKNLRVAISPLQTNIPIETRGGFEQCTGELNPKVGHWDLIGQKFGSLPGTESITDNSNGVKSGLVLIGGAGTLMDLSGAAMTVNMEDDLAASFRIGMSRLGTTSLASSYSSAFSGTTKALSLGGQVFGYGMFANDTYSYLNGTISGGRFSYRSIGFGASTIGGFIWGGPIGAAIGGTFTIGETLYDGTNWWIGSMSQRLAPINSSLNSGNGFNFMGNRGTWHQ